MKPVKGQRRLQGWGKYHWLYTWLPGAANTIELVTDAMVISTRDRYDKPIMEVRDINKLTKRG
jgi:hypothetical protein